MTSFIRHRIPIHGRISSVHSARVAPIPSRTSVHHRRIHHIPPQNTSIESSHIIVSSEPAPALALASTGSIVSNAIEINDFFHQRQVGENCRLHAINNLIGKEICSIQEFQSICSQWDAENKISGDLSRIIQLFYNNGNTENIFGRVLSLKGFSVNFIGYDFHETKPPIPGHAIGAILFNQGHTWAVRKHSDGQWWIHDSLRGPSIYRHISNHSFAMFHIFSI